MNFIAPLSSDTLLSEAEKENLYLKLIEQINKDFNLANEGIDFPLSTNPEELKVQLHEKIYRLIQYKFAEYLNLLSSKFKSNILFEENLLRGVFVPNNFTFKN